MSADWEMSESVVSADAMQIIDVVKLCLADPVWATDVSGAWSSTAIDHVSRDYRETYVAQFSLRGSFVDVRAECDFDYVVPESAPEVRCVIDLYGAALPRRHEFVCQIDKFGKVTVTVSA